MRGISSRVRSSFGRNATAGGLAAGRANRGAPSFIHVQKASFHDYFGGGAPGGGGGDTEFYDTLGVSKDASEKEIKAAYRKLAMKNHPDQGGDAEKFTKIQEAYEVLGDKEKRQQYDQFGKAGVDGSFGEGGGPGGFDGGFDMNDVFSQFFGGTCRSMHCVCVCVCVCVCAVPTSLSHALLS